MSAKESLLGTLSVLKDCLNDAALIDNAPTEIAHNARARMLRQGLAVLVFSTVETFIRERTGEVLQSFSNPALTFSDLSPALQRATTLGALEGVRFRLKLQPATSIVSWLVANLAPISGATTKVQALSNHSFGYASSNIDENDVREILKSFGVEAPWTQITALTTRVGVAILDAQAEFESIKERRHSSAHALSGHVSYVDLQNSIRSSLAICLAFDLLLSHSGRLLNLKVGPGHAGRPLLTHADIGIVFVAPRNGGRDFALKREQLPPPAPVRARATVRTFSDHANAITYGTQFASSRRLQLVIPDATGIPTTWVTW